MNNVHEVNVNDGGDAAKGRSRSRGTQKAGRVQLTKNDFRFAARLG